MIPTIARSTASSSPTTATPGCATLATSISSTHERAEADREIVFVFDVFMAAEITHTFHTVPPRKLQFANCVGHAHFLRAVFSSRATAVRNYPVSTVNFSQPN